MALYILASLTASFIGFQIYIPELLLLSRKYNYVIQKAQFVTYISFIIAICMLFYDIYMNNIALMLTASCFVLFITFLAEFILARFSPSQSIISWSFRSVYIFMLSLSLFIWSGGKWNPLLPFILIGVYLRNSTFGIPHKKELCMSYLFHRDEQQSIENQKLVNYNGPKLPDFSYAGNKLSTNEDLRIFNINDYGIFPDTEEDSIEKVQNLINEIGAKGGGKIFFPKGKYYFNKTGGHFLQINYSNIHLEGETDNEGKLVTELISCGPTICGKKNPWLSPFFITTGEKIQSSNEFWGLQFRKRKKTFSQSNSLSDPGSDGSILTPKFCTFVTESSPKGCNILHVENSSKIGKYIILGMYNTTADGNLIKDILGITELRAEWTTALRAGEEEAPSYQWLTEVKQIIDENTIELSRPLLRACDMVYEPAIFNVDMLENITIRNMKLNCKWNGMFRHHGFPVYYSIEKSQEMDYGWNAVNMKRVAHSEISNVEIINFTNPIYVLDSRNVTIKDIRISGHDGHQGIKIYQHTCDCLFQNITFFNHYADMLGGEGNSYGNVFSKIKYLNPVFNPVDFDFHGFGEGPMSPPADNLFECINGFRCIKSAGALYNLPSCAQNNIWWNIITEGEHKEGIMFYAMTYREKKGFIKIVTAIGYAAAMIQKTHNYSLSSFVNNIITKLKDIDRIGINSNEHYVFFNNSNIIGIKTRNKLENLNPPIIHIFHIGELCRPLSIYKR